ncbi:Imm32 family immunity protein [Lysobacter korlensis]|uniref:Imm32 family immunity protein n=1 Tax=Lysobacter korlensis TaxID=553636 RepID=A0ABV6S1Z0_9GAMM
MSFLTIESDETGEQILVHGTPDRLRRLASALLQLAEKSEASGPDHFHMLSDEWGGDGQLTAEHQSQEPGWRIAHHLKVFAWPSTDV